MSYPKWKYRRHPELGVFQSTLVGNAQAEAELGKAWSDDPASTGFAVRPATQMHHSHARAPNVLHEAITDADGTTPVSAGISMTLEGDKHA